MELVNRETNFNKVFGGADPKVGVLNPLAFNKVEICLFGKTYIHTRLTALFPGLPR